MADRYYAATPADFVVDLGAKASIVDDVGDPTGEDGWAVLIPDEARVLNVYDAGGTQITTLEDADGNPITQISSSIVFATAGQILLFGVNGGPEGDVYLSVDMPGGQPTYRVTPLTAELFTRISVLETSLQTLETVDLADWSATAPGNGDVPKWNTSTGAYEPTPGLSATALDDLSDVNTSGAIAGQALIRSGSEWISALVGWNNVSGKPATFPPSAHDHNTIYYTKDQIDQMIGQGGIDTIPTLTRFEDPLVPGSYPEPRGTARTDLVIVWRGTIQPSTAASGSMTDWANDPGIAMQDVDEFRRIDS